MNVRLRATIAATLVVAAALGLATAVLVVSLRGSLEASANAEAARKVVSAASVLPLSIEAQPAERLQLTADPDVQIAATTETVPWETVAGDFAIATMAVPTEDGTMTVYGRASLAGAEQALQTLNGLLLPGVPLLLAVVAGMTWFSVGRALAPVAAIRAKVADITARDLHQRVPVPESGDEIARLATTVNGTLDRLETAVERHKQFVADAAHELRSPIATLRARMELAEPTDLSTEALADVDRLQRLAGDLLLLARLDAGEPLKAEEVDLGQVVAEESLRPGAAVTLDISPDVVISGSRGHLARLVTNLVDNAVRHAATAVEVRVRGKDGAAVLEVLDDGPGIPSEHREAVFDRFTRLDEARARDGGGVGLGLPIARDIATLHGGTLAVRDGGFVARFPLRGPAVAGAGRARPREAQESLAVT
ncbi:ATP-binding protein [Nonomuraea sp. NPDC059194]|uniref:sensor histidine kinase n=1 Tax=Nonomuraea sp. NPDC059194 TaxID=3346764 RepID=UPI00368AC29C